MTQKELTNVFKNIVKKCDMLINNDHYEADAYTQDTVEDIAELCNHILDGNYGKLVEVKNVKKESVSDDLEEAICQSFIAKTWYTLVTFTQLPYTCCMAA